jgi:hypothetical protein
MVYIYKSSHLQSSEQKLKIWLLEQRLCRAFRIRRIGNDNIKLILIVFEELEAVSNMDLCLGVVEPNRHMGEILLGKANNSLLAD